jgi:Zn finger protein HypA/HybF involved in hydrogenase expression
MNYSIEQKYNKVWQSFSFEIIMALNQMTHNAEKTCLEHLERSSYNYEESVALWGTFKKEISELIELTRKKWLDNKSANALKVFMIWNEENNKIQLLKTKQYRLLDRFQVELEGKLAQKVYLHVQSVFVKDFRCEVCKEVIEVESDVLKKHQVSCPRCKTKMQYDPGNDIDSINETLTDKILVMECIKEYNQKDHAFQKIMDGIRRKITCQTHWEEFKEVYHNYYKKYFASRNKLCSNTKKTESLWKQRLEDYREFEELYRI